MKGCAGSSGGNGTGVGGATSVIGSGFGGGGGTGESGGGCCLRTANSVGGPDEAGVALVAGHVSEYPR